MKVVGQLGATNVQFTKAEIDFIRGYINRETVHDYITCFVACPMSISMEDWLALQNIYREHKRTRCREAIYLIRGMGMRGPIPLQHPVFDTGIKQLFQQHTL
jgi:hypothetical protein